MTHNSALSIREIEINKIEWAKEIAWKTKDWFLPEDSVKEKWVGYAKALKLSSMEF